MTPGGPPTAAANARFGRPSGAEFCLLLHCDIRLADVKSQFSYLVQQDWDGPTKGGVLPANVI
jgi:hypothetical protein